ncbi:MAG: radical SAM protein [Pirellulales bacterium]|nr:radical SAM protein [Pirellulales bacterium]
MSLEFRDYTFLGATQSLCPACLRLVPAKIIERGGRIYFRKRCPEHGPREDFVCSDANWWDRTDYSLPGKTPRRFGVEPVLGCPYDCGLCTEHEQHTCIGLLEINSACNLECPMCFASSGPGGRHLSFEECRRAIDRLVEVEGQPEILQISGGEPTIHPQLLDVWRHACDQPIDIVMINTNGVRLANDRALVEQLAERRRRTEIYLQFDGFADDGCRTLRGEPLVETKLRAIERLGEAGLRTTLVCTVQPGVNVHELGRIVQFGVERPWITGVSFQPAAYVGRHVLPDALERRVTFPDVIRGICEQSRGGRDVSTTGDSSMQANLPVAGMSRPSLADAALASRTVGEACAWLPTDFSPLPCAHPNAHTLAYAYRKAGQCLPLARFVDLVNHLDLLSGRITFDRQRARKLIADYLSRLACGGDCGCGTVSLGASQEAYPGRSTSGRSDPSSTDNGAIGSSPRPLVEPRLGSRQNAAADRSLAEEFFQRALLEDLAPEDVFRITTTSFMDAYNFDVRQEMKACVHFVLPTGHIVPFSAYNILYRPGHVALPPLAGGDALRGRVEVAGGEAVMA